MGRGAVIVMEDFRKELDELLGKDRNLPLAERAKKRDHFDDADVCHYFLVGVCPHDLFINTRSDMGRCKKRHDNAFKKQFLSDPNRQYYQKKYELELLRNVCLSRAARTARCLGRLKD